MGGWKENGVTDATVLDARNGEDRGEIVRSLPTLSWKYN